MLKKIIIAFVVLGVLAGGGGVAWFKYMRPVDPFAAAKQAMDKGDLRTALIELRNTVRADPNNAEAHFRLGAVQLRMGDPISAERSLRQARDNGFDPRPIIPLIAQTYMAQGKFRELLKEFTIAQTPQDQHGPMYVMRGTSHLQLGEIDEAQAAFVEAEKAAPAAVEPPLSMARVLLAKRDFQGAEARVDRALSLNARSPEALVLKAQLLNLRGDRRNALSALDTAVQQAPGMLAARLERANLLVALGDDAKAREDVTTVLRMEPRSAGGIYLQAVLAARARDFQTADASLTQIANLLPRFPRGYYFLGVVKFNLGQGEQALDAAQRFVQRNPTDLDGLKLLARVNIAAQRSAEGVQVLRKAIADGVTPDAEVYDIMGRALAQEGKPREALEALEQASKLAPDNADIVTRLAAMRLGMGDATGAAKDLETSLEMSPRQVDANEALVVAALAAGDIERAATALERAKQSGIKTENIAVLEGLVLSGQLKFDAARTAYINALRDYPGSLRARFNLARLANMQGRVGEVEQYLGDILRQEPANMQALNMLAGFYVSENRLPRAISLAEAARTAAPASTGAAALLADLYVRNNEARRALEVTDAIMKELQSPPPALILSRARAQVALGLLKEAQEGFRLILAAEPNDIGARRALVEIMLRDNSPDSARALLRDGLAAQPGHPALIQTLIGIDLREGLPQRALATLDELRKDPRNIPATRGLRGDIFMNGNNFVAAAQAYVDDFNEAPRPDLVLRAANALGAANRPAEASRLLTDWVAKAPDDMNARLALISYDIAARRHSEAEAQLEKVLEKDPLNAIALNNLAWLYHLKKDPRARTLAQKAWLLAPSAQIADTLGWILTAEGEAVAALPLLRQAARQLPGEPTVQYHLAYALAEAGIRDEAITTLRPLVSGTVTFDEKDDAARLLERLNRR